MSKAQKPTRGAGGRPRKERPSTFEGRLGERVEAERKVRGLTVQQLAEVANLATSSIIRLEAGGPSPAITTVLAAAHGLGLSGEQLLKKVPDWTEKPGN